jgi:hypothetical protein
MLKQIWDVTLVVQGETSALLSSHTTDIVASGVDEAKKKVLAWVRKELKSFTGKATSVRIHAFPFAGGVLRSRNLLRNRFKFSSLSSVRRVGKNKLFVVGYGPRQAKELAR